MSQTIQAVAFDLDGLMFNTEDIFDLAGKELMQRRGKVMTEECHHAMLGRRPEEAFAQLQRLMDIDEPMEALMLETKEIFESLIDEHLAPMPGVFELLNHIDERSVPRAVATSSPHEYMREMLDRYDMFEGFAHHLAAEDVTQGKPKPDIYLKAAERLGVEPNAMMVLEDSEAGTRAAAAAGAVVVSVPNRHTKVQDFSMATHVVSSLEVPIIRLLLDGGV
ncbi:MAG: HAD family hydrolase [Planctomycetaceae bacterium]